MKLSWRDLVTTLFTVGGGAIVYAKFYDYTWAGIGSWRSAVAVLAAAGVGLFAFSRYLADLSWLNVAGMLVGLVAAGLAITGMIVVSEPIFYILAATLGALWLVDVARHTWHSLTDHDGTVYHHHAPAH